MKKNYLKEKTICRFFIQSLLVEYCNKFNYDIDKLHIIKEEDWVVVFDEPNESFEKFLNIEGLKKYERNI